MQYALIQNGTVAQWPYSVAQMRQDNPNQLLPRRIEPPLTLPNGEVHGVTRLDRPVTVAGEIAEPEDLPSLINGTWTIGWTVRSKTAAEIETERAGMSLPRPQFALNAKRDGIITHQEAIAWATQQGLPQIVVDALALLPQAEREAAEFKALTAENVNRLDDLFLLLKAAPSVNLTDAQADALFTE